MDFLRGKGKGRILAAKYEKQIKVKDAELYGGCGLVYMSLCQDSICMGHAWCYVNSLLGFGLWWCPLLLVPLVIILIIVVV